MIDNKDRLFKIRPLVQYLLSRFQDLYMPGREISIDEQLLLHKGNLNIKQYIPNKRARFGVKMFSLCDTTGYLWNSEVYIGRSFIHDTTIPTSVEKEIGKSGAVVLRLMEPLLGKGYHLYTDNWYTSFHLYRYLYDNKTVACGTLRKNRAQFPPEFLLKKLNRGESVFKNI